MRSRCSPLPRRALTVRRENGRPCACSRALLRSTASFFQSVSFGGGIGVGFALVHQLGKRVIHQTALVFEVAARDGFALGMRRQPAFAVAQKFFHLVIAHPIVLVVVQDWTTSNATEHRSGVASG